MKLIPLTQGKVAKVDDLDFKFLSQFRWCAHKRRHGFTAVRNVKISGKNHTVIMARVLLNPPNGMLVDHINGDGLDNQRCNIRLATPTQNQYNRIKNKNSISKFKGVRRAKRSGFWYANIFQKSKPIHLGTFRTEEAAARAYDVAAKILFGNYARLNMGGLKHE